MSYQEALIDHLTAYKRSHLGEIPAGTYNYRGTTHCCDHILPKTDKWLNLLEPARKVIKEFLQSNRQIRLHRYFHHLNSSQAFTLNLFVPFFEGGPEASAALLRALGQQSSLVGWEPEAVPDASEGTNIDALWDTADGHRTFCEVKLSERDFGKAQPDERRLRKLRDIYMPRLAPHMESSLQEASGFFASYQILRNIWHMIGRPRGRLLFLLPRANTRLWPMLDATLAGVGPDVRTRVTRVAIEDVLLHLATNAECSVRLRHYAEALQVKYVPRSLAI